MKILNGITLTGNAIINANSLTVGTTQLITANGNIGIGVINPTANLQIAGATTTLNIVAGTNGQLIINDPGVIYANEFYPYGLNYTGVNSVGLHNRVIKNLSGVDDEHTTLLNEAQITSTADSTGESVTASYNTAFVKSNTGQIGGVIAGFFQANTSQGTGTTINSLQGLNVVSQHVGGSAGPNSYVTNVTAITGNALIQPGVGSTSTVVTSEAYGGNFIANALMNSTFSGAGISIVNLRSARAFTVASGATISNAMSLESLVYVGTQSNERANSNIVNAVGISLGGVFGRSGSTYSTTITNYYGLYMAGASINSNATIINKYGIYQVDTGFTNYFASRIGIGTTNPTSLLEISGGIGSNSGIFSYITNTNAGGYSAVVLRNTGASGREWHVGIGGNTVSNLALTGKFYIYDSNAGAVRAAIDTSGNMGIGTVTPTAKLDVVGEVRTSSRFGYGASAYTQYNSTTKSIDFIFA